VTGRDLERILADARKACAAAKEIEHEARRTADAARVVLAEIEKRRDGDGEARRLRAAVEELERIAMARDGEAPKSKRRPRAKKKKPKAKKKTTKRR
jgi:hypothetical protein